MHRPFFFLFLFGLLFSIPSFSQKVIVRVRMDNKVSAPKSDTIYYDQNRKLTWGDFKGKPDMNHKGSAVTSSGFAYSWNGRKDGETLYLDISVYTFFTKSSSWKKIGVENDYHLGHEQRHFDITVLGAENFINELQKVSLDNQNYKQLINKVFNRVYDENLTLQFQYDRETKHSLDKEKQEEWNERVLGAMSHKQ